MGVPTQPRAEPSHETFLDSDTRNWQNYMTAGICRLRGIGERGSGEVVEVAVNLY